MIKLNNYFHVIANSKEKNESHIFEYPTKDVEIMSQKLDLIVPTIKYKLPKVISNKISKFL